MPVARERVTATLFAVTTLVAVVVNKFVVQPLLWRIEPVAVGFSIGVLVLIAVCAGPPVWYVWVTRALRRRPATFGLAPDGAAFVVAESVVPRGLTGILLMFGAGSMLLTERVPDTDRVRLAQLGWATTASLAVAVALAVIALVVIWLPGPSLVLTPDGISVRYPLRRRELRWDELLPGGPPPVSRWYLTLMYRSPDGRPKRLNVAVFSFDVDPVFLATVVRHYNERPEDRGGVGTPGELERLESSYAAWRAATGARPA
ncbi:PH domain-containing protein [Dactylosporangium salmoneum]